MSRALRETRYAVVQLEQRRAAGKLLPHDRRTRPRRRSAVLDVTSRFCWNQATVAMMAPMPTNTSRTAMPERRYGQRRRRAMVIAIDMRLRTSSSRRTRRYRTAAVSFRLPLCRPDRCRARPTLWQDDTRAAPVPGRPPCSASWPSSAWARPRTQSRASRVSGICRSSRASSARPSRARATPRL